MKLALISFGSRGDLEPLVALALELQSRGHQPYIVANAEIESLASAHNVISRPLSFSVKQLLLEKNSLPLLASNSATKSLKIVSSIILDNLYAAGKELMEQTKDADVIVINERYYLLGQALQEKYKKPLVQICFQPKGITSAYPYLYYSPWFFKFLPNAKTHAFVDRMLLKKFLPIVNILRTKEFKLPPTSLEAAYEKKQATTLLQGFSPALFTKPADWNNNLVVTGNWSIKQVETGFSSGLKLFLNSPVKKVYIGFGSMIYSGAQLLQHLSAIACKLNIQFIWALNWSIHPELKQGLYNQHIFILHECNHNELFPFVDAVVHHGGSGTIAAATRNAKPQAIAWFMLDQHFWARQISQLSTGINLGSFHKLKEAELLRAIQQLISAPAYTKQAKLLSEKIIPENGPGAAVDEIEKLMAKSK